MPILINRVPPYPLEALDSFLCRLGRANYYEELRWYEQLMPAGVPHRVIDLCLDHHFEALARITEQSEDTLYAMTMHRFATPFQLFSEPTTEQVARSVFWNNIKGGIFFDRRLKICPHCWMSRNGSWLIPWSLLHITSCLTHSVILVDTCNRCNNPLYINPITSKCRHCAQPVTDIPSVSISNDKMSIILTKLMWNAIGCDDDQFLPPSLPFPKSHPVWLLSPPVLIRWFAWMSTKIQRANADSWWAPNKRTSVASRHKSLRTAVEMLLETSISPLEMSGGFHYEDWLSLHQSWIDFLTTQTQADGTPCLQNKYRQWLQRHQDRSHTASIHAAKKVVRLEAEQSKPLTLNETAKLLGIDEELLADFVYMGLIPVVRDLFSPNEEIWEFDPVVVYKHLNQLVCDIPIKPMAEQQKGYRLFEVQQVLKGVQKPLPLIFDVSREILPVYRDTEEIQLTSLWWDGQALQDYISFIQESPVRLMSTKKASSVRLMSAKKASSVRLMSAKKASSVRLMSAKKVCSLLKCRQVDLQQLLESGSLVPIACIPNKHSIYQYYSRENVDMFAKSYIIIGESAKVAGVSMATLHALACSGQINVIEGLEVNNETVYWFDREAILKWRYERLSLREVLTLLGITRATCDLWVAQGKLTPLENMCSLQRWFAREQVESLL